MSKLSELIRRRIAAEGPISISAYMADCLLHPQYGYYTTHDSIGAEGDFTTAPEISQMFGELLGLWAVDTWQRQLGAPPRCYLVELGPGRGTLMQDAVRVSRRLVPFLPVFVEASPRLREKQRQAVPDAEWRTEVSELPSDAPLIVIANEFLDALPIKQYQLADGAWRERCVTADGDQFSFVLSRDRYPLQQQAEDGAIWETCPSAHAVIEALAERIKVQGGAALFIDYGPARSGFGDTLQALRQKQFADPLQAPGEADLTAHVDFASLASTARRAGLGAHGPLSQGEFLNALGIATRAAQLKQKATPAQAAAIDAALHRLTADDAMGRLFQALALTRAASKPPAGFA